MNRYHWPLHWQNEKHIRINQVEHMFSLSKGLSLSIIKTKECTKWKDCVGKSHSKNYIVVSFEWVMQLITREWTMASVAIGKILFILIQNYMHRVKLPFIYCIEIVSAVCLDLERWLPFWLTMQMLNQLHAPMRSFTWIALPLLITWL